jgi:hypothetical protein
MTVTKRCAILCACYLAPGLCACSASDGAPAPGGAPKGGSVAASSSPAHGEHPNAVATVTLSNGNILEFYDFPEGLLVSEYGEAVTGPLTPTRSDLLSSSRFVDLVSFLRPDLSVPEAVVALEAKYSGAPPQRKTTAGEVKLTVQATGVGAAGGSVDAGSKPVGGTSGVSSGAARSYSGGGRALTADSVCSNICCDRNWTLNTLCNPNIAGANYTWYNFEYGWSWANRNHAYQYWGAACAGIGQSRFSISISDGSNGSWAVDPGYYRWYYWYMGNCGQTYCLEPSISSTVNDQTHQAVHTYCGGFWYY